MADAKEKNRQLEAEREKDAKERKDLENDIAHRKTYMWCLVNRKGSLFFGSVQGALRYLQSQRETLDKRDKGKVGDYPAWYAYDRTQSLVMPAIKMFFPKIANKPLNCVIVENSNLLLYNGMAFVGDDMRKMKILQKVLESDIFWNYVVANSKPYTSGYYSLNGSNIKNFGVPKFTKAEEEELLRLEDKGAVNQWLSSFYE